MRVHRMQEGVAGEATGGARGVQFGLAAVAVDNVVAGIARMAGIGDSELGVIEDVEGFSTKLDVQLLYRLEVLEQGDVEVDPRRIVQRVASGVAEGKASRGGKGARIQQQWPHVIGALSDKRLAYARFADHIRIGPDSQSIAYTGIVRGASAV